MTSAIDLISGKSPAAPAPKETFVRPEGLKPTKFDALMASASEEHGVPYEVLYKVLERESGFNPKAVPKDPKTGKVLSSAKGIAQFIDSTAEAMGLDDPFDPVKAIPAAAKYLKQNHSQFNDWKLAVAAYNQGPGAVRKAGKVPKEAEEYVKFVFPDQPLPEGIQPTEADRFGDVKVASSALDLINQKAAVKPVKPVEPLKVEQTPAGPSKDAVNRFYSNKAFSPYGVMHPAQAALFNKPGVGRDEFGRPIDAETGKLIYDPAADVNTTEVGKAISETLSGLSGLATKPMEAIRGGLDFFLSLPAFGVGMLGAAGRGGSELIKQLAYLDTEDTSKNIDIMHGISDEEPGEPKVKLDLEKVYDAMSKGMQESFEFFQPGKELLVGQPTKESQLVGEIAMAPLNALSALGQNVAAYEGFKDHPNIRGAARIAGDALGLMTMGVIMKGPSARKKMTRVVEEVTKEADGIRAAEINLANESDPVVRSIKQRALDIQKQRLENKASQFAEQFQGDMGAVEEAGRMSEEIAKAKMRPVVESRPEMAEGYVEKPVKLTKKEQAKVDKKEAASADESVKKINDLEQRKPKRKIVKSAEELIEKPTQPKSEIDLLMDERDNILIELGENKDPAKVQEIKKKLDDVNKRIELSESEISDTITDVDMATGTEVPEITSPTGVFFQDKAKTDKISKSFEGREKSIGENPELFVQKLINDVNKWRHGDKSIDIGSVRNTLSQMASRSSELRGYFMTALDHTKFQEMASEAANWARKIDRNKVSSTQLNMMIPVDKIPEVVRSAARTLFGKNQVRFSEVYRNKDLFKMTGFWFGKDGKWRYEINDKDARFKLDKASEIKDGMTIGDVIDHPKIFEKFPELKDKPVSKLIDIPGEDTPLGSMSKYGHLKLNDTLKALEAKYVSLHEIQHYVNRQLGSSPGSNLDMEAARIINSRLASIKSKLNQPGATLVEAIESKINRYGKPYFDDVLKDMIEPNKEVFGFTKDQVKELKRPILYSDLVKNYNIEVGEMEARLTSFRSELTAQGGLDRPPWESLDKMLEREGFGKEVGNKLYSGDPTAEAAARAIAAGARKVSEYTAKARGMKKFKPGDAARLLREEFNRAFIDRSGNIRRELLDQLGDEGFEIVQKMYLAKGASSRAAMELKQMRKEVYDGLSRQEKQVLDNVILSERMIDIAKYKSEAEFKHPKGLKIDNFIAYRDLYPSIEKLSPEVAAKIESSVKAYYEWMKKPLKDMLDAGLIDQKQYDALVSHNYRRLEKLENIFDKKYKVKVGKRPVSVHDSGIEALQRGRETDIYEPSSEIMALEVFNRAYGRVMNNQANLTLLDLARRDPENPFVRIKTKDHKVPSGWSRIFVFENGERKTMYLSPEMSKEWIINSPETSYRLSQLLRYASGSPVLRTFATGINWGFALANMPRDVMHAWFAARTFENGKWKNVYNPNLPIFSAQIGRDLMTVLPDSLTRGKRYQDYIKEGGGMEFLVHQGRLLQRGRHLESGIDKFFNFMGYLGETTEIMTRLAIRERLMRKGKSAQEATFAARDYMDFGQGGGVSKALDNALPYLNASIQGTRGLFRSFKPGGGTALSSTYKLAQMAAVTAGTTIAAWAMHPETMKNLEGNKDAENNLIIPLGDEFSFIDSEGQERYIYFKIPLDPGQKFFKTFFEAATNKWMGREIDVDRVVDSLKQYSPVNVTEMPPTVSGVLGYITNKNFWLNEDIWRQTDKPFGWPRSAEEYTADTPQSYVDFGKITGMSPERTKYAVEELVTGGTEWSYLMGKGYNALFGDVDKQDKEKHIAEVIREIPAARRFIGITNPYSKHAKSVDKAKEDAELNNFVENRGMDIVVDNYLYKEGSLAEVNQYLSQFKDLDTRKRLQERFDWERSIRALPEKSFWRRMKGLPLEAKANVFVERMNKADDYERAQLQRELLIVKSTGGVLGGKFNLEVQKVLREQLYK